jgi:NADH dehydrogenase
VIRGRVAGKLGQRPFRYASTGSLATIGRQAAAVQIGGLKLTGPIAWLVWSLAHVWFLIGFRNRVAVAFDWAWSYLTFERGARLITGDDLVGPPLNSHLSGRCGCKSL